MKTYALIELRGTDAHDYAHRMFSRNFKRLRPSEGALSLFLSPEGKVQSVFWGIKVNDGIKILVDVDHQEALFELIEKYHFAENFTTTKGPQIASSWRPNSASSSGLGQLEGDRFVASWRCTDFEFNLSKTSQENSVDGWDLHRISHLIPEWTLDFDQTTLLFDLGFEELCDQNKGCYIGQEVVERVRSRGGHGPRRLSAIAWNSKPEAGSEVLNSANEVIGSLSKSLARNPKGLWLSLAFLKRSFDPKGQSVQLASGPKGQIIAL